MLLLYGINDLQNRDLNSGSLYRVRDSDQPLDHHASDGKSYHGEVEIGYEVGEVLQPHLLVHLGEVPPLVGRGHDLQPKMCALTPANEKCADFCETLQLITHGTVSSKPLKFLRYLYPFQRYAKFSIFVFLTVHAYLKTYFYENYTVKSTFYAEFRPQCEAFLIKTRLFMSSKHCRMGCGEDKSLLFFAA